MDDLTSGRKRARIPDLPEIARALGVAPETLGAHLLAIQQGEPEPKPAPTLKGQERGRQKALAAQFEVSQSLVRTAISRRGPGEVQAPREGDEASAAAETAPEAAPGER
jgi:hypothetical protein